MPKKNIVPVDARDILGAVKLVRKRASLAAQAKAQLKANRKAERSNGRKRRAKVAGSTMAECTTCPLCGASVALGKMLEHKAAAHGEQVVAPSPVQQHRDHWVSVYQGGLPSLGKRSR